jgi:ammonia channel protein AmtB
MIQDDFGMAQNTLDACLGGIVWWIFGYPLAYGDPNDSGYSSFIAGGVRARSLLAPTSVFSPHTDQVRISQRPNGGSCAQDFAMSENGNYESGAYAGWMFQWAFAAAAATIVSVRHSKSGSRIAIQRWSLEAAGLTRIVTAGCRG